MVRQVASLLCATIAFSQHGLAAEQAPAVESHLSEEMPLVREQWFHDIRSYPRRTLPSGARRRSLREREQLVREQLRLTARANSAARMLGFVASESTHTWTPVGPAPASTFWNSGGNGGNSGRATALAVDPTTPTTVYLGTAGGGVWKTIDAGSHWMPLTDMQASLAVGSLAIDPSDSNTIFVGTGEANYSSDSYLGEGILKSTDGGSSWTLIPGPFGGQSIGAIAISPADPSILLAGDYWGIFRSNNAGRTWTQVLGSVDSGYPGSGFKIIFDPGNATHVYAALGNVFGSPINGIYESRNSGQSWISLPGHGANMLPSGVGRVNLISDPSNSSTLYVSVAPPIGSATPLGIFKSIDSGQNWIAVTSPDSGQCCDWYGSVLAISPTDEKLLYAGAGSLVQSIDGGVSWTIVGGYSQAVKGMLVHPDEHAIAFTSNGKTMYLATDGGIYRTMSPGPNISWESLNAQIATITFYNGIALDPGNLPHSIGGTQDNGTLLYSGSATWLGVAPCGDGGYAAFDSGDTATSYAACGAGLSQGIWKSTSNWADYTAASNGIDVNDRAAWTPPITMDSTNAKRLYFGTDRVYQTLDGAGNWTPISSDLTRGSGSITAVAVAPSDANTVYTGASSGVIEVTSDALSGSSATWNDITSVLPLASVSQIAVDAQDASAAIVAYSAFDVPQLERTNNRGAKWSAINGNLPNTPVNAAIIDPVLANTYYIGTDVGVFATTDGGQSWEPLGQGLPNVVVTSLALHNTSRTLRAGTHGRSAWDLPLNTRVFNVSPRWVKFGPALSKSKGETVTLTITNNQRATALTITGIKMLGGIRPSTAEPRNGCGRLLAAGASCLLHVSYAPSAKGPREGSVGVLTNAGTRMIPVDGRRELGSTHATVK